MNPSTFAELIGHHKRIEILCAIKGTVVRILTANDDGTITMDYLEGTIDVPAKTPIVYEPWHFDRGSLIFDGNKKLATELDIVRFEDGTTETLNAPSLV